LIKKIGTALLAMTLPLAAGSFLLVASGLWPSTSAFHAQLSGEAVSAAVSGSPSGSDSAPPGIAPGCYPLQVFAVRGSGEHFEYGTTVGSFVARLKQLVPAMHATYVDYPAIDVPIGQFIRLVTGNAFTVVDAAEQLIAYHRDYQASVEAGEAELLAKFNAYNRHCNNYPVVFAGYSQGADVTTWAFNILTPQYRIIMANFGDPHFNPYETTVNQGTYYQLNPAYTDIDEGSYNPALQAILVHFWGDAPHHIQPGLGVVHSWCVHGDPVCNYDVSNVLGCATSACPHYHYMDSYTAAAARWAYQEWRPSWEG